LARSRVVNKGEIIGGLWTKSFVSSRGGGSCHGYNRKGGQAIVKGSLDPKEVTKNSRRKKFGVWSCTLRQNQQRWMGRGNSTGKGKTGSWSCGIRTMKSQVESVVELKKTVEGNQT